MDELNELEISDEVLAEFEDYAVEGLAMLNLKADASAEDAVKAVNDYIDQWQEERREKPRDEEDENIVDIALGLGIVWGNALCMEFDWEWTCLEHDGNNWYVVVSPDRAYACYPAYDVRSLLQNPEGDNCALLLFNMLKEKQVPESKPDDYLALGFG